MNRKLTRFFTLTAACALSLTAGAYLSYEAAQQQDNVAVQENIEGKAPSVEQSAAPEGQASVAPAAALAAPAANANVAVPAAPQKAIADTNVIFAPSVSKNLPVGNLGDLRPGDPVREAVPAPAAPQHGAALTPNEAPSQAQDAQVADEQEAPADQTQAQADTSRPAPQEFQARLDQDPPPSVGLPDLSLSPPPPPRSLLGDLARAFPDSPPLPPVRPVALAYAAPDVAGLSAPAAVAPAPAPVAVQEPAPAAPAPSAAAVAAPIAPRPVAPSVAPAPPSEGLNFSGVANALAAVTAAAPAPGVPFAPGAQLPGAQNPGAQTPLAPEPSGGFRKGMPVYVRIFKQEGALELWMKRGDRYALYKSFAICKWSGALGPKLRTADFQSPEGFYSVSARQLNPHSHYHLAFDIGYPNAYDRRQGATGSAVMVHGDCKSVGCFAMTNQGIDEIYPLVEAALLAGQHEVPVHIFPFRMSEAAIAREAGAGGGGNLLAFLNAANGPKRDWTEFWHNLKQGYDQFEQTHVPPVAYACGDRYDFGQSGKACSRIAGW
jgi:murein L,D-transpeptidase YafK